MADIGYIVAYGSYRHAPGEAKVTQDIAVEFNEMGIAAKEKRTVTVSGQLLGDPSTFVSQLRDLHDAYSIQGQDFALLREDGSTPTHIIIRSADTLDGVRVTKKPSFPVGDKTELVNFRSYEIGLEATYSLSTGTNILAFSETLSFQGGGPRYGFIEGLIGLPQGQTLNACTVYEATQQGSAIGRFLYPNPPDPIFPSARVNFEPPTQESPKRTGPVGQPRFTDYKTSWNYKFKSATPLNGYPTLLNF